MLDLNDLVYFAHVAEHGGFAAAGRTLGIPKSKLSRRVAQLEDQLGVRLLQRSTRKFAITEAGQEFLRHCTSLVAEARAAEEAMARTHSAPQGTVRVSCPIALMPGHVAPIASRFLADHPQVRLIIDVTNRRVDVIEEGYDIAIRVRTPPLEDSELIIRVLESHGSALMASPALLDRAGRPSTPEELAFLPSLDMVRAGDRHLWRLSDGNGTERTIAHTPRLVTDDMGALRRAALEGIGVVQLPWFMVAELTAAGRLERLLPDWTTPQGIVHAAFPSRRGLAPAVRRFLDALADGFRL